MKKNLFVCISLVILIMASSLFAQAPDYSAQVKEAMSKLSLLNGTWKGDGWSMDMKMQKNATHVTEKFTWKLDNTVLLIEGLGLDDSGNVAHNALATLFFDPRKEEYRINSHTADGQWTDALFEVMSDTQFKWTIDAGGALISYIITIKDNTWHEIGTYEREGMPKPMTFLEMTLTKQ